MGWNAVFTLVMVVVLAVALWNSRDFGYRAGLFPWAIGIPVLVLAAFQLVLEFAGKAKTPDKRLAGPPAVEGREQVRRTAAILGWIAGYLALIWLLGFTVGGILSAFLTLKLGSREPWPITLAMTAGMGLLIYVLFVQTLHVPFPPGELFVWLGVTG